MILSACGWCQLWAKMAACARLRSATADWHAALLNDDPSAVALTHADWTREGPRPLTSSRAAPRWGKTRAFRDVKTCDQVFRPWNPVKHLIFRESDGTRALCNVVKQEVGCFLRLSLSFSSCSAAVFTHKPLVQSGGVRLIIFSALDLFNTRFPILFNYITLWGVSFCVWSESEVHRCQCWRLNDLNQWETLNWDNLWDWGLL